MLLVAYRHTLRFPLWAGECMNLISSSLQPVLMCIARRQYQTEPQSSTKHITKAVKRVLREAWEPARPPSWSAMPPRLVRFWSSRVVAVAVAILQIDDTQNPKLALVPKLNTEET